MGDAMIKQSAVCKKNRQRKKKGGERKKIWGENLIDGCEL